jgi:glycosyltransferase involved in cell wall biosynthesis
MLVSVIVRARNEAEWLGRCLFAIAHQSLGGVETILVDNESTDGTLDIAESYGARIVQLPPEKFSYGRALNTGIAASTGRYVALVSAHCVPRDNYWLASLLGNFQDPLVAGVYGRQEPMPDSSDIDKRDLWTTFGIERRVQRKDYFFHNANSMVRRSVWQRHPFDEELTGVEDRYWAKEVLANGYSVVYEPHASVYHHHGIHQGRDERRAQRVVRVIEMKRLNGS